MAGQNRYHIFKIHFTSGAIATAYTTDPDEWRVALEASLRATGPVWLELARWDTTAAYGRETEPTRYVQVNMQHVTHAQKWSEYR
jgi:hypothetical protein